MHRLEKLCRSCNITSFGACLSKPGLSHPGHKEGISPALPQFHCLLKVVQVFSTDTEIPSLGSAHCFPSLPLILCSCLTIEKSLKCKVRIPGIGPWLWSLHVVWPWTNHLRDKRINHYYHHHHHHRSAYWLALPTMISFKLHNKALDKAVTIVHIL